MRLTRAVISGAVLLALVGCAANPYKQFYMPNQAVDSQSLAARRVAPPPERAELLRGNDPKTDAEALAADGYVIVGQSSFNGPQNDETKVLEQAKAVGADRVVIYGKYARTIQTAMPLTLPTTQTAVTTGSATAFGSGGMATAYGSATTTTYGTQTTYVPVSVDRYDFLALYLVKMKFAFGAQYRSLQTQESQQAGSVNGVVLVSVVHGSPAAAAGFVPGDMITKVNGQAVIDQVQFQSLLKQNEGRSVTFTTVRNGTSSERRLTLATNL